MSGPRRIAVLGAGGFLGSHLVPALLSRFDGVVEAVDTTLTKLEAQSPRIVRHETRIEASGFIEGLCERADVVISLTALCNPSLYSTSPLAVIDANYTHLVPLVERCSEKRIRLVHFSTAEIYGRTALDAGGDRTALMNEDDSCSLFGPVRKERWSYACAKQLLERLIWAHGAHRELPFTIIRPFNVIGPRMDYIPGIDGEGIPRVLASFIGALLHGHELPIVDGGRQRRTFIAVEDFVEAIAAVVERPQAANGQIFNVGNPDNDVSIRELAELLARTYAERVPSAPLPRLRAVSAAAFYGPGYDDSAERVPDIAKARRLLDWQPRQSLKAMLPGIVDDYVVRYGA